MEEIKLKLKLITPAFCGGAIPETQAEIRAPSIRGQLRWWFRVLGGLKSLSGKSVKDQESLIFGSVSGTAMASQLIVRVKNVGDSKLISKVVREAPGQNTEEGYFLFPLRNQGKACFDSTPDFELILLWKGDKRIVDDIRALGTVFGHLGSLGFRSRRAMGALAFVDDKPDLEKAFSFFSNPNAVIIKQLDQNGKNSGECISSLAKWLKGWRSHGRNPHLSNGPGFAYAKRDHDIGLGSESRPPCRPALGLPIIQRYSSQRLTNNWEESWNPQKRKGEGRFASPVILRPYMDARDFWKALVIFVESMKWPTGKKVYLNGSPKDVSLELYEAMKKDTHLSPFTG